MDRFGLDCAGTKTGSFKMQLVAPGTNQGVQYFAPVDEGPTSFDRVGIYAESIARALLRERRLRDRLWRHR